MDRNECYIGLESCGCILKALVKSDFDNFQEEYDELFIDQFDVQLVSVEEARERLGYCKVHNLNERGIGK